MFMAAGAMALIPDMLSPDVCGFGLVSWAKHGAGSNGLVRTKPIKITMFRSCPAARIFACALPSGGRLAKRRSGIVLSPRNFGPQLFREAFADFRREAVMHVARAQLGGIDDSHGRGRSYGNDQPN
jgi:hypothetical protein